MSDIGNDQAGLLPPDLPADEGGDADVDALLNEFDTGTRAPAEAPPAPAPQDTPAQHINGAPAQPHDQPRVSQIEQRLNNIQTEIALANAKRDFQSAIQEVRGSADPETYSDDLIRTFCDNIARGDARLQAAWLNRHQDPQSYRHALATLGRRFQKEVVARTPDRQATEDRELVSAAVRGASTKAPEAAPPSYHLMDDATFTKEKDKLFNR